MYSLTTDAMGKEKKIHKLEISQARTSFDTLLALGTCTSPLPAVGARSVMMSLSQNYPVVFIPNCITATSNTNSSSLS